MQNILIVVDMQTDFVDGALGTAEAQAIVPAVTERIRLSRESGERILFTRDTHGENYMDTAEGKKLPVPHCIRETDGWQIIPALCPFAAAAEVLDKPTFGSTALAAQLAQEHSTNPIGRITLIGLCTDICVISNAMLLKAALPEVPIFVQADCCAGVTPQSHENALNAMKMCQIEIV